MVPNTWILQCLKIFKVAENVRNVIEKSMKNWKVKLTSGEKLGEIKKNRHISRQQFITNLVCHNFDTFVYIASSGNSPRQSQIAEGFSEANSVFIVITSAKILPRWIFPNKIYIQFTIYNTYFSTKLLFTNKRYQLTVLEKCLRMLQEVRSIKYFRQFIHPLSLCSRSNGHVVYHCMGEILWRHISKQVLFCFILLPFVYLPAPKKNKNCDIKQKLFI